MFCQVLCGWESLDFLLGLCCEVIREEMHYHEFQVFFSGVIELHCTMNFRREAL